MKEKLVFKSKVSARSPEFLQDHRVYGQVVYPATAYVEMALAVGKHVLHSNCFAVEGLSIENSLTLDNDSIVELQTTVSKGDDGFSFAIFSRSSNAVEWTRHALGVLKECQTIGTPFDRDFIGKVQDRCIETEGRTHYERLKDLGLMFGPSFQGVVKEYTGDGEALAEVAIPEGLDVSQFNFHPGVLDACFQAIGGLSTEQAANFIYLPVGLDRLVFLRAPDTTALYSYVRSQETSSGNLLNVDLDIITASGELYATIKGLRFLRSSKEGVRSQISKSEALLENIFESIWVERTLEADAAGSSGEARHWLIFTDAGGVGELLADQVRQNGDLVCVVKRDSHTMQTEVHGGFVPGSENLHLQFDVQVPDRNRLAGVLENVGLGPQLKSRVNIVYLWGMDRDAGEPTDSQEILDTLKVSLGTLLSLIQVLPQANLSNYRLTVVTELAQAVAIDGRRMSVNQSAMWGFCRVVAVEQPELGCLRIDLDSHRDPNQASQLAKRLWSAIVGQNRESQMALRFDRQGSVATYALRLGRPKDLRRHVSELVERKSFFANATYMITGGLGALGLGLAKQLVEHHGVRNLALVGRSAPAERVKSALAELKHLNREVNVNIYQADIADPTEVKRLISQLRVEMSPLKGIVHAAGVIDDASLGKQKWSSFEKVMSPKILGCINLHKETHHLGLDFFVCFSSATAMIGNFGQSNYAAANAWIDAFSIYQSAQGFPFSSVNWGPWEVGMAAQTKVQGSLAGLGLVDFEQGMRAFEFATRHFSANFAYLAIDWAKFRERIPQGEESHYSDFIQATKPPNRASLVGYGSQELEQIGRLKFEERRSALIRYLSSLAERVLGLEAATIDSRKGLMSLGMDSMLAVDFRQRLVKEFGSVATDKIPATLIFNHPTLEAVADYLLKEFFTGDSQVVPLEPIRQKKMKRLAKDEDTSIAVVGIGCRFPGGATTPRNFWKMVASGTNAVEPMKGDRWDVSAYYDPDPSAPGKTYLRHGAFLDNIKSFAAAFFGISPREAVALDPQQRLLLEVTWETIEHAGLSPSELIGKNVGVFVGSMYLEYLDVLRHSKSFEPLEAYVASGNNQAAVSGRLSYVYGFRGPAVTVDTACSSSLVAIDLAAQKLKDGQVDYALAGGVNVIVSPFVYTLMSRLRPFSFKGRCATFDASADGYLRGEGCGLILMRRLSDAKADGDRILAVIRATGVNQDGISSSFSAPNGEAQQELYKTVLDDARLQPHEVTYVEAHGTGTPLGDPIEMKALENAYAKGREKSNPLFVGSVKTNIGHTESAAGIAGVIKTILSIRHGKIAKHLHFSRLNPEISFASFPAAIPTETQDWKGWNGKRIAGVSSFGITGTNAHVILEQYVGAGDQKGGMQ